MDTEVVTVRRHRSSYGPAIGGRVVFERFARAAEIPEDVNLVANGGDTVGVTGHRHIGFGLQRSECGSFRRRTEPAFGPEEQFLR
jgi:hypothetical protein